MAENEWLFHHMRARGWVAIWRMINVKIITFVDKTCFRKVLGVCYSDSNMTFYILFCFDKDL